MPDTRGSGRPIVRRVARVALALSVGIGWGIAAAKAWGAPPTFVSVDRAGNPVDGVQASVSADGRFVAFSSLSDAIVDGDTNGELEHPVRPPRGSDVFVHDRRTCRTRRVSVRSDGGEANNDSFLPAISGNGRFVAFLSWADNFVDSDIVFEKDVVVHDRVTGKTEVASVSSSGELGMGSLYDGCRDPAISDDGRFVVFSSGAENFAEVPACSSEGCTTHVYLRDRQAGTTRIVDQDATGNVIDQSASMPEISGNGRIVAFVSDAALLPADVDHGGDVYLKELATNALGLASRTAEGRRLQPIRQKMGLSSDGCVVLFVYEVEESDATGIAVYDCRVGYAVSLETGTIVRPWVRGDGAELRYLTYEGEPPAWRFVRRQRDGSGRTVLSSPPAVSDAVMSADGDAAVFEAVGPLATTLVAYDAATGEEEPGSCRPAAPAAWCDGLAGATRARCILEAAAELESCAGVGLPAVFDGALSAARERVALALAETRPRRVVRHLRGARRMLARAGRVLHRAARRGEMPCECRSLLDALLRRSQVALAPE